MLPLRFRDSCLCGVLRWQRVLPLRGAALATSPLRHTVVAKSDRDRSSILTQEHVVCVELRLASST